MMNIERLEIARDYIARLSINTSAEWHIHLDLMEIIVSEIKRMQMEENEQ